jgi:pimeloyl-ACP methyl ester carboxylesterase
VFAGFLARFMQAIGVPKASLVGQSMGAQVALSLAVQYPQLVDRLVLATIRSWDSSNFEWIGLDDTLATTVIGRWMHEHIRDALNKEVDAGLADPKLKARLAEFGALPLVGSAFEFGGLVAEETEKWGKVVKFASIGARCRSG